MTERGHTETCRSVWLRTVEQFNEEKGIAFLLLDGCNP